jgi:CheY-like chemotaxis protein
MRSRSKVHPELASRLDVVEAQVQQARRDLDRAVRRALTPLDIQKNIGVSQVKGDILVVTRDPHLQQKVQAVLSSEQYRCDIAENVDKALGYLKLRDYRLVVADCTARERTRIFEYIQSDLRRIRAISIVSDESHGREMMQRGNYSYLISRDFDPEQLRTCLVSSLRMGHRVCRLLANGEKCNRSCINNYWSEADSRAFGYAGA